MLSSWRGSALDGQILLPPIKTVASTIQQRKFYLLNYVSLMCTPTITLNLPLQ